MKWWLLWTLGMLYGLLQLGFIGGCVYILLNGARLQ